MRRNCALLLCALTIVSEIWGLGRYFLQVGFSMYVFYTECSNTLALVSAALVLWALVRNGKVGERTRFVRYVAACMQTMTFLVVLFVLVPLINAYEGNGFEQMFLTGGRPVTHFVGPVLTVLGWLVVENTPELAEGECVPSVQQAWLTLVPTLLYAAVSYLANYLRWWKGPYPFLQVWDMPVWMSVLWFVVLFDLAAGIAHA